MRERDTEIINCTECGALFNLAAQYYYSPLCPNCAERDTPYEHS